MKKLVLLAGSLALVLATGCNQPKQAPQTDMEKEVQHRVEERLAEERRAQQDKELQQREQQLADREKQIADREAAATAEQERQASETAATTTPEPAPEPAASVGVAVNDDTDTGTAQNFYDDLDPYGDWIETPDYGYVFRPSLALRSSAWRPYEDGRWVYTDDGWAWVSNEPFGWATYHYGRWVRLRGIGWTWVPGSEWAPAWVSWRYGDDYCGWAPLPPEARFGSGVSISFDVAGGYGAFDYVFVPTVSLCESSIRPFIVDRSRNVTIINRTINVTHIERTRIVNRTVIINRGPRVAQIEALMKRPLPRLKIERQTDSRPGSKIQGDALQVSVPAPRQVSGPARPRRVKEKTGRVEVERGAATTTTAASETLQAKPTATSSPVESPLDAQRGAVEQEQARQKRLIDQQRRARAGAASPQPENIAGTVVGTPEPTPEPRQTATPQDARRRTAELEQLRLQRQANQQAQDEQVRQQREAAAAQSGQMQQQLQQRKAEQDQLRQQRLEEQRAQQQQDSIEKQRAQADRGQALQQRRLEQQQQLEQQRAAQEQRGQELQSRQQAAQEAAAQKAQQQVQQREGRQQQQDKRKRKGDENNDN
jgi:hypothetical protein